MSGSWERVSAEVVADPPASVRLLANRRGQWPTFLEVEGDLYRICEYDKHTNTYRLEWHRPPP